MVAIFVDYSILGVDMTIVWILQFTNNWTAWTGYFLPGHSPVVYSMHSPVYLLHIVHSCHIARYSMHTVLSPLSCAVLVLCYIMVYCYVMFCTKETILC